MTQDTNEASPQTDEHAIANSKSQIANSGFRKLNSFTPSSRLQDF